MTVQTSSHLTDEQRRDYVQRWHIHMKQMMTVPGFYEFGLKVQRYFATMRSGQIAPLSTKLPEQLPWLLVMAGELAYTQWQYYYINDDYTGVVRR